MTKISLYKESLLNLWITAKKPNKPTIKPISLPQVMYQIGITLKNRSKTELLRKYLNSWEVKGCVKKVGQPDKEGINKGCKTGWLITKFGIKTAKRFENTKNRLSDEEFSDIGWEIGKRLWVAQQEGKITKEEIEELRKKIGLPSYLKSAGKMN